MPPERKELSQQDVEILQSTASWLNAELEAGASVWRGDIAAAIRSFPNPILIDLDGTLVADRDRSNIQPDAREALQRAEKLGSVFIVTNGLTSIDYLRKSRLASTHTVLITRQNYGWSPDKALPPESHEAVQQYIAMQNELGRNYNEDAFDLVYTTSKHLAPLFMRDYPVPLIDNSLYTTHYNPGIWGIPVRTWPYSEAERSYMFLTTEIVQMNPLLDAIGAVESFYATEHPAEAVIPKHSIGTLAWVEGSNTQLTSVDQYTKVALGIQDIWKYLGGIRLTEIIGHSTEKHFLNITSSSSWFDGIIRRFHFWTSDKAWVFSVASSPIAQGLNHGFNWLMYSRYQGNQLVEYGHFNQEEAGIMTIRENPGAKYTNAFKVFEALLSDIFPQN